MGSGSSKPEQHIFNAYVHHYLNWLAINADGGEASKQACMHAEKALKKRKADQPYPNTAMRQ